MSKLSLLAALHVDEARDAAWLADLEGIAMTWVPQSVIDGWLS